jgi:hypothetical protein
MVPKGGRQFDGGGEKIGGNIFEEAKIGAGEGKIERVYAKEVEEEERPQWQRP